MKKSGSAIGLILGLAACAAAETIQVPAEAASVQAALDLSGPGDTVLVAAGSYEANLIWPATPGIKLLSEKGAEATVLDAGARDQVIGIYSGVDSTTLIRGFTITGGIAGGQ
jgi:hypothetical protein